MLSSLSLVLSSWMRSASDEQNWMYGNNRTYFYFYIDECILACKQRRTREE